MFGFLKSRTQPMPAGGCSIVKSLQCALCHALRHEYQMLGSLLAGWDCRFLLLLIYSQSRAPDICSTTRCPACMGLRKHRIPAHGRSAQYAAAVSVRLFREKLVDRIRDDRSILAKLGVHFLRRYFNKAGMSLAHLAFPVAEMDDWFNRQASAESAGRVDDLHEFCRPFSRIVGLLMAHTSVIAGAASNYRILDYIGRTVGRMILIMDACQDYARDDANNQFNLIRAHVAHDSRSRKLTRRQFEWISDCLYIGLQTVRTAAEGLTLQRHAHAVHNVLLLGLYDSAVQSLDRLEQCADAGSNKSRPPMNCIFCGRTVGSRFCPHCGRSPRMPEFGRQIAGMYNVKPG